VLRRLNEVGPQTHQKPSHVPEIYFVSALLGLECLLKAGVCLVVVVWRVQNNDVVSGCVTSNTEEEGNTAQLVVPADVFRELLDRFLCF
jgi:hypothetical protein